MKKVLVATSTASMVYQFLIPSIKLLQEMGYEVHVACNFKRGNTCSDEQIAQLLKKLDEMNVSHFQVDFTRDAINVSDIILSYKQVKKIIVENKYEFIHCHSPIGGAVTRFACRKVRKNGTKVFYTAHGFHFYKGAPLINWCIYYPVEKFLSRYTDTLITINKEDYKRASDKFKSKKTVYIPGVGIDIEKFSDVDVDRTAKRRELGIPENAILLLSIGELNENKNHETAIRAIADMDVYYIIAGKGGLMEHLQCVIDELGMTDRVKLLGHRKDINELCKISDIFVFPSFREGLSVALMEAMASGLPCVVSDIRGNRDLVDENGMTCCPDDIIGFTKAIKKLVDDYELRAKIGNYNRLLAKKYDVKFIIKEMNSIYKK